MKLKKLIIFSAIGLMSLLTGCTAQSSSAVESQNLNAAIQLISPIKRNLTYPTTGLKTNYLANSNYFQESATKATWTASSNKGQELIGKQLTFAIKFSSTLSNPGLIVTQMEDEREFFFSISPDGWYYTTFNLNESGEDFQKLNVLAGSSTENVSDNIEVNISSVTAAMLYEGADVPVDKYYESSGDLTGPLLSGSSTTYYSNVDSPVSVSTIKSKLTAIDETDGDVSDSIVVKSDEYTGNERVLGSHEVVFAAYDSSDNESLLNVTIVVQDQTKPTITGPASLSYGYGNPTTIDAIKSLYTASDNHTESLAVEVKTDNYSANKAKIGSYTVILRAVDESGNEATKTITIKVTDDVAPVITGPNSINKNNGVALTIEDIKSQFSATDAIDGKVDVTIVKDEYTGNANVVGDYKIIFQAVDAAGNKATKTLTINVVDNIAPVWYVDNTVIHVASSLALSTEDVLDVLIKNGEINSGYSVATVSSENFVFGEAVNATGDYIVTINARYFDGNEVTLTKSIEVYEAQEDVEPEPLSFFEKLKNLFFNIWNWFLNIFREEENDVAYKETFYDWFMEEDLAE